MAAGTLVEPDAVASNGAAALWTPAVVLNASGASLRVGIETIHTPSDIGVNGGIAAVSIRVGSLGTLNAVYARIGLDDLVRTETSPEGLEGSIPVYAQVLSVGGARGVTPALLVGAALRFESGRLADLERSQVGLDVGIVYTGITGFRLGATTRFWDPTLGASEQASGYAFGGQYRTEDFPLWGTRGTLVARYGLTLLHGESPQQLLAGGLVLGEVVELDVGAAHEKTDAEAVWRARFGLSVRAGRYRIVVARDAGVNDFGATYRFGLSAVLR
ncbi:MAG: hypothetical protein HYR48_01190 [Gemmatimonadetes bacterium]|nr:hypothetical protein [Gemmatimonadota bacterium]